MASCRSLLPLSEPVLTSFDLAGSSLRMRLRRNSGLRLRLFDLARHVRERSGVELAQS